MDENGLGPRLGPLLVTGVLARAENSASAKLVQGPPMRSLAARLGDSKRLVGFGHSALGEAWARAILRSRGVEARGPAELLERLSLDGADELRGACPGRHGEQCWLQSEEPFQSSEDLVASVERDLGLLGRYGIEIDHARLVIVCVRRLNEAREAGLSRLEVDLRAMERLFVSFRQRAGAEVDAVCGKVGGIDRYRERFGVLPAGDCVADCEGRNRSAYRFGDGSCIAFVTDAEGSHMLVALASLIGKWARDLLMSRIVSFYRAAEPSLPLASGYQDPVTRQFVEATQARRAELGVPHVCFERR